LRSVPEQAPTLMKPAARMGLVAGRAARKHGLLARGTRLLRQVVVEDHSVHAVVAEVLAHGAAGERRQVLHRRRIGRGGGDHARIVGRAMVLQHLDELRDRRALPSGRAPDPLELDLLPPRAVARALGADGGARMIVAGWPRPIGVSACVAVKPVAIGSCTGLRGMMPGALTSTRRRSPLIGPLSSIGLPSASTTRPSRPLPTGTSTMARVRLTVWPSLISRSLPKITMPTLSLSRLSAMPRTPFSNSTISPDCT